MESQCIRVKLKPGKAEQFLAWANTLSGRENEVRECLLAEGMSAEFLFFESSEEGDFVVLYTQAKSLAEANKALERSTFKLDLEAKEIMTATWDFSSVRTLRALLEIR